MTPSSNVNGGADTPYNIIDGVPLVGTLSAGAQALSGWIGQTSLNVGYRLRRSEAGWRIIDIYFNGTVSELALRRSEYSSLIKREGFDALLVKLDERIAEYATGNVEES